MKPDFIHLRIQSSYSFLESALTIEQIVKLTKSESMPAVCLSDNGNLFGSLEFAIACAKASIQPIHGSIVNISYQSPVEDKNPSPHNFAPILLIAKDTVGYKNLLKLVSYTFTKNDRKICNHITVEDLASHQQGIIALSCYTEGIIGKSLLAGNKSAAIFWTNELKNIFGDRFYFEIMRHNLEKEHYIESAYLDIAAELSIPLVASNIVLFSKIDMYEAHDVLLCISAGVVREELNRKRVSNQCYFKSSAEMQQLFHDLPEALENTVNIAQRCYVMAQTRPPMLPSFTAAGGNLGEEELIRKEALEGLLKRLEARFKQEDIIGKTDQEMIKQQYLERLNYELDIICKMNFPGYFLIVSDFIKWSKAQGIAVGPGRGSGAGSMVAWCLLITDLDPIKFGLLFERFLNPERISMPDFDIDFCQERRQEVIDYVRSKYGNNRVGQIITFGKMQAKAVIKDVARVLGLSYLYANYLTELVPFNAVNPVTLNQAIEEVAELKQAAEGKGLYNLTGEKELIQQVLSTALTLEGLNRHASVHAAGIVIAGSDLVEIVPVCMDASVNMLIVQYSMKYAELAGLMKFDFLGLQTLTVITKCLKILSQQGIELDISAIPFDDPTTYSMLSQGHSVGVFQFESIGMKEALRRLKPDSIQDLIALGALYRPGPMENIPIYIACKHGKQQPDYLHPLLKPILEETYGVIIYQEQVLEIAKVLAGYSLGSADLLRRAMGKKIKAEMDAQQELFLKGATSNNISSEQAKSIFATVAKFAGYGFNKAHASAYGVISYQTAYLKANFPTEFLTTCLNLEINNQDKINIFIQEAKNNHIKIISPTINLSAGHFTVNPQEKHSIIYGLSAIKGVSANFSEIVVKERNNHGMFKNIVNFVERIPPQTFNRRLFINLIKAGCFDCLNNNRYQLFVSVTNLMAYAVSHDQEKKSSQFSLIKVDSLANDILIEAKPLSNDPLSYGEFEVLGLFINNHPLKEFQDILPTIDIINSSQLSQLDMGSSQIKIAGIVQKKDARMSARGRFVSLQLSDQFGIFEVTVFSEEALKDYAKLLTVKAVIPIEQQINGKPSDNGYSSSNKTTEKSEPYSDEDSMKALIVVYCDAFKDEGGVRLTARNFIKLEDALKEVTFKLKLYPSNLDELKLIINTLENCQNTEASSNNSEVTLLLTINNEFVAKVNLRGSFCLRPQEVNILNAFNCE